MKQLKLIAVLLLSLTLFSCSDDDDNGPTFQLADLTGEWTLEASTDPEFKECPDNPPKLIITETKLTLSIIDTDSGCAVGSTDLDYTFDGRVISTEFIIPVKITVKSLTDTQLVWDYSGTTETYVR